MLQADEIYTLLLRLDSKKREAAKTAVRSLEIDSKTGLVAVQFAFLDPDFMSKHETKQSVIDGVITKMQGTAIKKHYYERGVCYAGSVLQRLF